MCRAVDTVTKESVLLREVRFLDEQNAVPANLVREISLLKEIKSRYILRLLNVVTSDRWNGLCLVYESLNYNLRALLSNPRGRALSLDIIKIYLHQILCAVAFLHSHKIVHRDLKPENLFVDLHKHILKVGDLGLGRALGGSFEITPNDPTGSRYMAPELLFNTKEYSCEVDIWSVGCIFAEMTKMYLFFNASIMGLPNEETWPGVNEVHPFLHCYTKTEPQDLRSLLPLGPDGFDLILRMLCMYPKGRIRAIDALEHPFFDSIPLSQRQQ
ncbi:Protein kinase PCTAIRE [Handroanthus impetiginosus]|uniref:cyclin-dependent kinase n=1 Tax=Handroanthus impetiginosus TaxID=429701 RepID=A0A2G9H5W1_9LAMI|nr:Protein kinase PCTAIRE [Handroanthus impetiginosus]